MKRIVGGVSFLLLLAIAGSQEALGQAKPDLLITRVQVGRDTQGFVTNVTVKVTNVCKEAAAGESSVQVSFLQNEQPNAKVILTIGNSVKALAGGESQVQNFPVTDIKIGGGRHVLVQVDPAKQVAESNEDNNWWKVNPNSHPKPPSGQYQCSPKI